MRVTPKALRAVINRAIADADDDDELASATMLYSFGRLLEEHLVNRPAPKRRAA